MDSQRWFNFNLKQVATYLNEGKNVSISKKSDKMSFTYYLLYLQASDLNFESQFAEHLLKNNGVFMSKICTTSHISFHQP